MNEEEAQATAKLTRDAMESRGWCFWRCEALGGDIITVIRNESVLTEETEKLIMSKLAALCEKENKEGVGMAVYTIKELEAIGDRPESLTLVHEAKKQGAEIVGN